MNPTIQDPSGRAPNAWNGRAAHGDPYAQLERASMDAGYRSYWRSLGDGPGRIVMDSPPGLEDVRPWLAMRDLLLSGDVRVPDVLAIDTDLGFLLLEDLGGPTLAHVISEDNADTWFDAAIEQLLRLQAITPPDDMGESARHLAAARCRTVRRMVPAPTPGADAGLWRNRSAGVVAAPADGHALSQARVLTHRDFMPRNLMPITPGPAVLDFQDCVRGPVAYDAMSLFKDAFLSWPIERVDGWLARYHARATRAGVPVPELKIFLRDADWMGIQRHLKILGIFSRLHYRDGKTRYLPDVPRFIRYLDEVLPRYQELSGLRTLLDSRIKPVLHARGEIA